MTMPRLAIEGLGWLAAATFIASYFFSRPGAVVRVQIAGGAMWVGYGVLVHSTPVIAANVLVVLAACWKIARSARTARGDPRATAARNRPEDRASPRAMNAAP